MTITLEGDVVPGEPVDLAPLITELANTTAALTAVLQQLTGLVDTLSVLPPLAQSISEEVSRMALALDQITGSVR